MEKNRFTLLKSVATKDPKQVIWFLSQSRVNVEYSKILKFLALWPSVNSVYQLALNAFFIPLPASSFFLPFLWFYFWQHWKVFRRNRYFFQDIRRRKYFGDKTERYIKCGVKCILLFFSCLRCRNNVLSFRKISGE